MKVAVRDHAISIVLLIFNPGVRILSGEASFTCNILILCKIREVVSQTLQSFQYRTSDNGSYSGVGGTLSYNILIACCDYGDMEHWFREFPRRELVG